MQVGVITIGGVRVGIITQSEDAPDMAASSFAPLASPHNRDLAESYGGPEHYSLSPRVHRQHEGHRDSAHAHGHRHGPGHYARGEAREQEQRGRDLGAVKYSNKGNPFDRARFARELEAKPWLREKMAHISLGENQDPRANLAVIETMMNRAVVRGTSLEVQVRRHRSSGKDESGYYAGWAPHYSSDKKNMFDRNLGEALRNSNVSNYATDNSSGNLAAREIQSGAFRHHVTINRESFFSPGHAEPQLRDRWSRLSKQATEFEKSQTSDTAAGP